MIISYNWLSDYLPESVEPAKLSKILTAVGLEVESITKYESIKGGLKGLIVGEVLEVTQHPNADKLKLANVNLGLGAHLNIVCGATNLAVGQKVVVAPVGTTIYPLGKEAVTMKLAKIRGEESHGMICAEDEIGLGDDHAGILVLPASTPVGSLAADYFKPYTDYIIEIGLTPNRMDAMSHFGVARDVCAYLSFHQKTDLKPKAPSINHFKADNNQYPIGVTIANKTACRRYAGLTISGVTVAESPQWLKDRLQSIGQRPINNIVDITNYILHETGQPLHAFDLDAITGGQVEVRNLTDQTSFITLDEKERKLSGEDLMICNKEQGMCIAGVFGGASSGVTATTKQIFLESAWFDPITIRKTSFRHGLRTEAATRFEKGVDISNVVIALKRAALMIKEVAGGLITSDIVDVYPDPATKNQIGLKYHYLKKLSGKNYHPDSIKKILSSLGFEILKEGIDELWVAAPFSKPDISLPADLVEEILRIDGLDNIEITGSLTFTPSVDENGLKESLKEKISQFLVGKGFSEIVTNSITNSKYYTEEALATSVKMINSLSADLDVLRPSMVETGLEAIAYNQNRKNNNLRFFELGKTYQHQGENKYVETEHLCLYLTGKSIENSYRLTDTQFDLYSAKGLANAILKLCGVNDIEFQLQKHKSYSLLLSGLENNHAFITVGEVDKTLLTQFGIKQPVYILDFNWNTLVQLAKNMTIVYKEVSRYPIVSRDLAIVVDKNVNFDAVKKAVKKTRLQKLTDFQLFDIFENEKIGAEKKSLALSFLFADDDKTLTDQETDGMMKQLMEIFKNELGASIRD